MRIAWRNPAENTPPPRRPTRIPQRWVVILGVAGAIGAALGVTGDTDVALTMALSVVALLHSVME
ncbi:hypothetical protein ACFO8L_21675 [Sphaerisporangium corydalis]|uniref:Uncharacterized protein n=1 Tax=Sphaerisporangium corydalis TaxID=1441875 RepID=A0ABV9EHT0_9ACTN